MEQKDKDMLKGILAKKRDCIELTRDEQKYADETFGKLFASKFKSRVFTVKTGDEVRAEKLQKNVGKPADVQPEAAIADERSKFHTKDAKIENDDNSGAVKETEEGDNINVDEKDGEKAAEQVNGSDFVNADNEAEQRKPVLKYSDVVIKTINGRKYAGLVVKFWPEHNIAQIKWANGTFSNSHIDDLELLTKSYEEEKAKLEVPKTDTGVKDVKKPGTDVADENVGLKPAATKSKVVKADKPADDADEAAEEAKEDPKEEASETPEEEAAEEAQEPEMDDKDSKDSENEWTAKCVQSMGKNANVENPQALCRMAYGKVKKSADGKVSITKEEIAKDNPKLAKFMEDNGHNSLTFETKTDETK